MKNKELVTELAARMGWTAQGVDLYQFIRIDTFRHDRYEFSQKALGTILVLTCIFGQQTGQILYRQPVIHGRLIL